MKRNELMQIKGLSLKELKDKAKSLRDDIANLILDKNMKKLKDIKMIYKKRKDLARILTIKKQKELLAELEPKIAIEQQEKSKDRKQGNTETQKVGKRR